MNWHCKGENVVFAVWPVGFDLVASDTVRGQPVKRVYPDAITPSECRYNGQTEDCRKIEQRVHLGARSIP